MTRPLSLSLAALLAASLLTPARAQAPAGAPAVELPAQTPVTLSFVREVKSGDVKVGEVIHFRVEEDVIAPDGTVLIRRGATAYGKVTRSKRAGLFGKRGALEIEVEYTHAVDRQRVALTGEVEEGRKGGSTLGRVGEVTKSVGKAGLGLVTSVFAAPLAPLGLFSGGGLKGKNVTVKEGTRVTVAVAKAVQVALAPAATPGPPAAPTVAPPAAQVGAPTPAAPAGPLRTLTLVSGEVLVGHVVGLENGVYTVVTRYATLRIPEADVREISTPPAAATLASGR